MSKMVTGCIKMFLIIHTRGTKLPDYQRIAAFRDLQIQIRFSTFVETKRKFNLQEEVQPQS